MIKQERYYLLTFFENTSDLYNGFEEMLRERVYHYKKSLTPLDFWVVKNIKINGKNLIRQKKENDLLKNFEKISKGFTIITTNKVFFDWIKLRYGYFQNIPINFDFTSLENLTNSTYTIDGFYFNIKDIPFLKRKTKLFMD